MTACRGKGWWLREEWKMKEGLKRELLISAWRRMSIRNVIKVWSRVCVLLIREYFLINQFCVKRPFVFRLLFFFLTNTVPLHPPHPAPCHLPFLSSDIFQAKSATSPSPSSSSFSLLLLSLRPLHPAFRNLLIKQKILPMENASYLPSVAIFSSSMIHMHPKIRLAPSGYLS